MELQGLIPHRVLEIGAANGMRLAALGRLHPNADLTAVEVSRAALADGSGRHPHIHFVEARADDLPLTEPFDLIIVNFVLHWIGRPRLLRVFAEIDRLLVDGGHLVIGDFHPEGPVRTPYHHLPDAEVFTYKQDYSAPLVATGLYGLVSMVTVDHRNHAFAAGVPETDRSGVWLLRKGLYTGYRSADTGTIKR